jgi:predicted TIM-barrel fold metal-dependent hydrolase
MNVSKIISADDHVQETPDLWEKRLPAAMRSQAPKIVGLPDGGSAWTWAGNTRRLGMDVWAGREVRTEKDLETVPWEKVNPATYEPHARLKAMDDDDIYAAVLYPNFARTFVGMWLNSFETNKSGNLPSEVALACIQAYNDHIAEFCATDSKRLIPIGIVPMESVETAAAEIKRIAKKGVRGALIPPEPGNGLFWNDPKFEPIFKTMAENNIVVNLHVGAMQGVKLPSPMPNVPGVGPGSAETNQNLGRMMCSIPVTTILWSGVFDRYPELKFMAVETDVGWLSYVRHRAEWVFKNSAKRWTVKPALKHNPGYYFGRNFYGTFQDDYAGIHGREMIGVDALCWASDFPHPETTWPNTKESLARQFEGVPESDLRKLVCENSARIFDIPI